MLRKFLVTIFLLSLFVFSSTANANRDCSYLGPSDYNTFKEYCYKITDAYLSLRNKHKVDGKIDSYIASKILNYSKEGLNYLPDNLNNKNYYTHLKTAIERAIKDPENVTNFDLISSSVEDFLSKTEVPEITGNIEVFPASGNAPLTVTLRGNVTDPTGSQLENYNYTWWISNSGKRKIIGNNKFLNYTFREEGNYFIFLDVTSNHKNSSKKTDVIPFSQKVEISVKEKVASLILKVNSKNLDANDELKFSPEDSIYGLLFDATSSIPTSGTKFIQTEWNFGNGTTKKYNGGPKIERVVYATEGEYPVILKLKTNTGKELERKFNVIIRNPIATINSSSTEGFLGDKFTFTANSYSKNDNLNYFWEIVDLKEDKVVFSKNLSTLSYSFANKGRYNVKLVVTSPSGEKDYDNQIIYINSRPPVAFFNATIPNTNKPNTVFLDASSSYDLDFSDDGKLEYSWIINGNRVNLDNPNYNGSNGYFTFSNIGEQSIVLEVRDPDDLMTQESKKINIASNLSVDFNVFPRVSQAGQNIRFVADSPKAKFFEWNFGDGAIVGGKEDSITHKFTTSGIYNVRLSVRDDNDNINFFDKVVYVGDSDSPYAHISLSGNYNGDLYGFKKDACNGKGAYIVNKVDNVSISGIESIDVTGNNNGLDYTWKIGDKFYSGQQIDKRFDDIGCFPVKLTVKSQKNGKEAVAETYLKVENLKPELTGLDVSVKDLSTDPVIVDVRALGAQDRDGIIQSYLWYYYTDVSNEPQDFRATKMPSTTFVLPKITGTYYFVAVLKDNNEERVSSEDLTGSKFYITLTGDNINTPIVGLTANNTSVKAGEDVVFKVNVTNILGKNLNNDVKYSWDFDGDGFYDKESTKPEISHKFNKSGEYRVKLKVKNKGFSNTKTITINVSNILKPDFDYISIGNDFVFFDKSSGSADTYIWEMGDGERLDKKGSFVYTYTDGKSSHLVKLKLVEGTNIKETSKKVVRNLEEVFNTRKSPLSIYSNYKIDNDKIVLKEEVNDLQIFLKTNLTGVKYYSVDFNIENDSDLNGGKDDDDDNKNTSGFNNGGPINIELNSLKNQKIKLSLKDENYKTLESKLITINKEYIKEEVVSSEEIKLDGVSDSLKNTFEKIKEEINKLDPENKDKSIRYLQKLQEEWNDQRERTNIIMEFVSFINESNFQNGNEIISLLEGLLVEDSENKTEYGIVLSYLKNVIPKDIVCHSNLAGEVESKKSTCYDLLISKLELISENNVLEENKALAKEILDTIKEDKTMTNEQKIEFRSQLYKIVNKGKAPEKGEVESGEKEVSNGVGSIFGIIVKAIIFIFALFLIGTLLYFIYYKIKGNKEEQTFTDFISEKTDNKVDKNDILNEKSEYESNFDPLLDDVSVKKSSNSSEAPSWLKGSSEQIQTDNTDPFKDNNSEDEFISKNNGAVPEWLKGSFEVKEEKEESKLETEESSKTQVEVKENLEELDLNNVSTDTDGVVPEWLKGSFEKEEEKEESKLETEESSKTQVEVKENLEELDLNNVSTDTDGAVPEWLKGSFEKEEEKEELKLETEESSKTQVEVKENLEELDLNNVSTDTDGELPDWLKGSFEVKEEKEEPKLETEDEINEFIKIKDEDIIKKEDNNIPDWLKGSFTTDENNNLNTKKEDDEVIKKSSKTDDFAVFESLGNQKTKNEKTVVKEKVAKPKKTRVKKENNPSKVDNQVKENNKNEDELWDDGMKIPDWLKTDSDK